MAIDAQLYLERTGESGLEFLRNQRARPPFNITLGVIGHRWGRPLRMNRWNIPDWLENEVVARDRSCVYCRVDFTAPSAERRAKPSWEHIINDARIVTRENIVLCCVGCNASKGTRTLSAWLESKYCVARGITRSSVASIVKAALESSGPNA